MAEERAEAAGAAEGGGVEAVEDLVHWDVVEEHLDEAEFGCDELDRMFDHPLLTLAEVGRGIEARLHAQLDGLVLGEEPVAERLLAPAIVESGLASRGRITAATIALLHGRKYRLVGPGLLHEEPHVRAATLRGCQLAGASTIEAWALDRFREQKDASLRAALLPLVMERLEPSVVLECLQKDEPELVRAAARAVSRGQPRMFGPVMEYLLEHEDPDVRQAALLGGLAWGSSRAWSACQQQALATDARADTLALWALLAGPAQHEAIAKRLQVEAQRAAALFALGFSGNPAQVPVLIEHLGHSDPLTCKLASQSIALITGLDLRDDDYALPESAPAEAGTLPKPDDDPEAREALPELEDDDLDADLVPAPEHALPSPNPAAIAKYWDQSRGQLDERKRYLRGLPLTLESVFDALEQAPLRVRHVLALMLGVRTAGQCWLDTRLFTTTQRERLTAMRTLPMRGFARQHGYV